MTARNLLAQRCVTLNFTATAELDEQLVTITHENGTDLGTYDLGTEAGIAGLDVMLRAWERLARDNAANAAYWRRTEHVVLCLSQKAAWGVWYKAPGKAAQSLCRGRTRGFLDGYAQGYAAARCLPIKREA